MKKCTQQQKTGGPANKDTRGDDHCASFKVTVWYFVGGEQKEKINTTVSVW